MGSGTQDFFMISLPHLKTFTWYKIEDHQHVTFVKMKMKSVAKLWWQRIDNNNFAFDWDAPKRSIPIGIDRRENPSNSILKVHSQEKTPLTQNSEIH